MKLSPHAFTRFWDVHAWAGVIGGLLLYVMFLTGSITLFHEQLETWEEPLAQRMSSGASLQSTLERGFAAAGTPRGAVWFYPPRAEHGTAKLSYQLPNADTWKTAWIDAERRALVPERERLSSFLYSIHFLWHDATGNWLYYLAGGLALVLLLALVTGVLIYLKNLVRQFHQFRPDKSRRVLWSDMHKVLGFMGLPFQLMYAYTGAFIVLGPLVLGAFTGPVFGGDEKRAARLAWSSSDLPPAAAGSKVPVLTADVLVDHARRAHPGLVPEMIKLTHHGYENGLFEVLGMEHGTPSGRATVRLRETDGTLLDVVSPKTEGATAATRRWLLGLHFAYFGGLVARFLFFVLGLATCFTILTGNWIWLARRESQRASVGNRLLSRLSAGFGVGTLVAIAAMFFASRLFPLEWSARGSAEELTFVGVLGLCIGWALAARDETAVWWQGLAVAGAALLVVPIMAARWSDAGLFGSGLRLAAVVGVDVALLVTSAALLVAAGALRAVCIRNKVSKAEDAHDPVLTHGLVLAQATATTSTSSAERGP
jgi:uncharacterized iron-regulated membrane protein